MALETPSDLTGGALDVELKVRAYQNISGENLTGDVDLPLSEGQRPFRVFVGPATDFVFLDLNVLRLRLHTYMRFLEQVVIDTLARWGVQGRRDAGATGVWTDAGKICALGVRVSRWVSMHGLALNVTTNLDHFELIVPCGLAGRLVTSLGAQLGDRCPGLEEVKRVFVEVFRDAVARQ